MPESEKVLAALRDIVGERHVLIDDDDRAFYSRDLFFTGHDAYAVIQPGTRDELAAAVRCATAARHAVIARGGGLSYTKGYVPAVPGAVIIDTRRLNRVLALSPDNMTVTAECGCTWEQIYQATSAHGLRPIHFGPTTGRYSTLGGGLANTSMFLNSGRAGTAGDVVVGLEVVIADGRRITTGSGAIAGGVPFFRNHGPDLTGLFLNDAGGLGIKASATLRLERIPNGIAFGTFGFASFADMIDGALAAGRSGLAAECLGMAAHPVPDAADAPGRPTLHFVTEGVTQEVADIHRVKLTEAIGPHGVSAPAVVPKFIRDDPFGFLTAPLDAGGRRQIWTHGIFPFDRAATGYAAIAALLDQHREQLTRHHIDATVTIAIAMNAALIEPVLTWPEAPTPLHLRGMGTPPPSHHADNPPATAVVRQLRDQLRDLYAQLGAAHLQLGKFYAFSQTVAPEAHELIRALKCWADPENLLNPGALGLS